MQLVKTKTCDIHIGIDPDVDKSGFAIWNKKTKSLELYSLGLLDLFDMIMIESKKNQILVHIEAGWLINKTNWHRVDGENIGVSERKSHSVGRNHEIGRQIEKFCIEKHIEYILRKPLIGKKSIIGNAELFKRITKYKGRSNKDSRVAGLLVYGI